jgi:uncharacterized phage infection (PIP) family protein YhgE
MPRFETTNPMAEEQPDVSDRGREARTGTEAEKPDLETVAAQAHFELQGVSTEAAKTHQELTKTYGVLLQLEALQKTPGLTQAYGEATRNVKSAYEALNAKYQDLMKRNREASVKFADAQNGRMQNRLQELRTELTGKETNRNLVAARMAELKSQEQKLGAFTPQMNENQAEQQRMADLNRQTLSDIETAEKQIQDIEDGLGALDAWARQQTANPADLH